MTAVPGSGLEFAFQSVVAVHLQITVVTIPNGAKCDDTCDSRYHFECVEQIIKDR